MGRGHAGKVAVVTGAASGIGQAYAIRLAEDGADIVVADLTGADETVSRARSLVRRAASVEVDVPSPESVDAVRDRVDTEFGRCGILVNNAGIYPAQPFEAIGRLHKELGASEFNEHDLTEAMNAVASKAA